MNILGKIKNKELIPIGWGTGLMFRNRKGIHDFDVAFTIHTKNNIKSINKISVHQPEILDTIDRKKYILIAYTIDYLDFIYNYCQRFDDLMILPFNDHQLEIQAKLKKVTKRNFVFQNWGVFYENFSEPNNVK